MPTQDGTSFKRLLLFYTIAMILAVLFFSENILNSLIGEVKITTSGKFERKVPIFRPKFWNTHQDNSLLESKQSTVPFLVIRVSVKILADFRSDLFMKFELQPVLKSLPRSCTESFQMPVHPSRY